MILRGDVNFAPYLIIGRARQIDATRLGDSLQSRRYVDAIAHEVSIVLHDDVAEVDADAELDALVWRHAGTALSQAPLYFDRRTHRIHHRRELGQEAIPGVLDDASAMLGD